MEIIETIFEWLGKAGQIAAIGAGFFLIVVGFLMKKWSRVGFIMAGVIILLPYGWCNNTITVFKLGS